MKRRADSGSSRSCSAVEPTRSANTIVTTLRASELAAGRAGVAALVVTDRGAALNALGHLLAYLPSSLDEPPPRWWTADPVDRLTPEAGAVVPDTPTGGYDVRDVVRSIVDDGELLELREQWAPNLVTALATIGGHPVGVVANQPLSIAGTLDIPSSQKTPASKNAAASTAPGKPRSGMNPRP